MKRSEQNGKLLGWDEQLEKGQSFCDISITFKRVAKEQHMPNLREPHFQENCKSKWETKSEW